MMGFIFLLFTFFLCSCGELGGLLFLVICFLKNLLIQPDMLPGEHDEYYCADSIQTQRFINKFVDNINLYCVGK